MLTNPADAVKVPRKLDEIRHRTAFTIENQRLFLSVCTEFRWYAMLTFAFYTGCRQGEMIALLWKDIDFDKKEITINKSAATIKNRMGGPQKAVTIIKEPKTTSRNRTLPLCDTIADIMRMHYRNQTALTESVGRDMSGEECVFTTLQGDMLDYRHMIKRFHIHMREAGLSGYTFHSMRHSFATRLIELNVNMKVVQEYMGHSSFAMTANTYSHVLPQIKKSEIEVLNQLELT